MLSGLPRSEQEQILTALMEIEHCQERARSRLLDFTCYTNAHYRPSSTNFHATISEELDKVVSGETKRLILNMPPRHGKSELVSRRLPALFLGKFPQAKVMATANETRLARENCRDVRRVMESVAYRELFPASHLPARSKLRRTSDLIDGPLGGSYRAAGIGANVTGFGFDLGIVDDPYRNRADADSPVVRERIWKWLSGTFLHRADNPDARIVLIMHRWNIDDMVGRLKEEEKAGGTKWRVLSFEAIKGDEHKDYDSRKPGEPLWPERFGLDYLQEYARNSPYDFASLFQQDPRGQGTAEWPADYFPPDLWFDDWPQDLPAVTIALDPSKGKNSKTGDYAAFVIVGRDHGGTLWIDAELVREPAELLVQRAIELHHRFKPMGFACEVNQFQELLKTAIDKEAASQKLIMPLFGYNNMLAKETRIRRLGPVLASKKWRVRNSPGGRLLVKQLQEFPTGMHDDGPDALEMALRLMQELLLGRNNEKVTQLVAR